MREHAVDPLTLVRVGEVMDRNAATVGRYCDTVSARQLERWMAHSLKLDHVAARERCLAGDDGRATFEHMPCGILLHVGVFG